MEGAMMRTWALRSAANSLCRGTALNRSVAVTRVVSGHSDRRHAVAWRHYSDDAKEGASEDAATDEAREAPDEAPAEEAAAEVAEERVTPKVYSSWRDYPVKTVEDCEAFLASVGRMNFSSMNVSERQQFFDKRDLAKTKIQKVRDQEHFMEISDWVFEEIHEFHYSNSAHPVINPVLKENMYRTWAKDPENWTIDKLAQKFRVKKFTAEAIVMLKIEEKRLMKENPLAVIEEGDEVDFLYAKKYGMVGQDGWCCSEHDDRIELNERLPTGALYGSLDEEVDQEKALSHIFRAWTYPESLPAEPPNPEERKDGQFVRGPDTRNLKGRRRGSDGRLPVLIVDTSHRPDREVNGTMLVLNKDKSMRHATWEERCEFHKRPMTGERARKRLAENRRAMDPISFPVDAEEERMMKEQEQPWLKNKRWARPMYVTEKETYRLAHKGLHLLDRHVRP